MALHASAARLEEGGRLLVYGAKDEGIRSAMSLLDELFPGAETLAAGGRARVLLASASEVPGMVRGSPEDWRVVVDPEYPELGDVWVSYPGVFAHPRLDPGTRLLLDALPPLPPGARVLDYGCGSGMVGAVARARSDGLRLTLLDVDALALKAAEENVPGAQILLRDGLPDPEAGSYDAILTNPPFHRGKEADPEMVRGVIRQAPALLGKGGRLIFVTLRTLAVERALAEAFREVSLLAEGSGYRIWQGAGPRR
jgi:16S rRNA (guanine1207-N2)-methyltransferase